MTLKAPSGSNDVPVSWFLHGLLGHLELSEEWLLRVCINGWFEVACVMSSVGLPARPTLIVTDTKEDLVFEQDFWGQLGLDDDAEEKAESCFERCACLIN